MDEAITLYSITGEEQQVKLLYELLLRIMGNLLECSVNDVLEELRMPLETSYLGAEYTDVKMKDGVLEFQVSSSGGRCMQFENAIRSFYPDLDICFCCEDEDADIYQKHDPSGKFFSEQYILDVCYNDIYDYSHCLDEKEVFQIMNEIFSTDINTWKDFNDFVDTLEDNYPDGTEVHLFEYEIC